MVGVSRWISRSWKRAEYAFDTFQLKPENIFMFKLLNFEFEYDTRRDMHGVLSGDGPHAQSERLVHGGILTFADTSIPFELPFKRCALHFAGIKTL